MASIIPESHLYTSTLVNNKLYLNIKYQRIYKEYTTVDNQNTYITNSTCRVINSSDFSQENISSYKFNNTQISSSMYNFDIKSDISGNTYHIGYTIGDPLNNQSSNLSFFIPTFNIINRNKRYNSHIIKYGTNYQIESVLTFTCSTGTTNKDSVIVNDFLNIDGYNYAYLTSSAITTNRNYYYRKDNNTPSQKQILNDSYNIKSTCGIIKFDKNFNTTIWYTKFYASVDDTYVQNVDIDTYYEEDYNNFKIVEDKNKLNIYASIKTNGSKYLLSTSSASTSTNIVSTVDTTISSNCVHIVKLKCDDGSILWSKQMYFDTGTTSIFLHRIISNNDNIYFTIKSVGRIIIDNTTYNTKTNCYNIFVIKMDKDGNFIWSKQLGTNNTYVTDLEIYNGQDEDFLYVSGYYEKSTTIGEYDIFSIGETSTKISSFVAKINPHNGDVIGLIDKRCTGDIKIKTLNVVDDKLYIGGDFVGGAYIGGNNRIDYKNSSHTEFFIEEVKINSF